MEKDKITEEEAEAVELVLFQVPECYVYMIPPRKSAASYRADEWNVNKWTWEGTLKVISKREECIIRLEDKTTGELYARAFLRDGELHPVEAVIDSSRYFVLRVEENIDGRLRHAFIGIGFRERSEAYDFQAALHDHMKYLNKKKTAEEMEHQYQHSSSVDYSLKDGETLVLQLKKKEGGTGSTRSKFFEQKLSNLSLDDKSKNKEGSVSIKLPPPPPAPLSPVDAPDRPPLGISPRVSPGKSFENEESTGVEKCEEGEAEATEKKEQHDAPDDDFGDFQAAR
ncbi:NECAP-like protein CG9132 [Salvia splendens]|nr:NECAP-like protein CG9132 [Salvia splendens]